MVQRREEADAAGEAAARASTALREAIDERGRLERRLSGVRSEVKAAREAAIAADNTVQKALTDVAGANKVLQKATVNLAAATATTSNALEGIEGGLDVFDSPALAAMRQALSVESARATAEQQERESLQAQLESEVEEARDAVLAMQRQVAAEKEAGAVVLRERDALKSELVELSSVDWARALLAQRASLASLRRENAQLLERVSVQQGASAAGGSGASRGALTSGAAYAQSEMKESLARKTVEIEALKHRILDTSRHWANAVHVAREHEQKMLAAVSSHEEARGNWSAERHRLKDFVKSRDRTVTRLRHDLALLASVGSASKEKAAKLLVAELARTDSRIRRLVAARTEQRRYSSAKGGGRRPSELPVAAVGEEAGAAAAGPESDAVPLEKTLKEQMLRLRDRGDVPGSRAGDLEDAVVEAKRRASLEMERAEVLQHQLDTVVMGVARSAGHIAEQHALIASLQTRLARGGAGARGSIAVWA